MKVIFAAGKDVTISTSKKELERAYSSLNNLKFAVAFNTVLAALGDLYDCIYDEQEKEAESDEKEN